MNRFDKIDTRNNKPHYAHLSTQQKALVKAIEKDRLCIRDMAILERSDPEWRKTYTGQFVLECYSKAIDTQQRYRHKLNIDIDAANELHKSAHTSRFYGGSY